MPNRGGFPMPIQRWRLTFARDGDAPDLGPREQIAAWHSGLERAGLLDPASPDTVRVVVAAPAPAGLTADRELADLFLPIRRTAADVRSAVGDNMPPGHRLVDLHDVWLGEPPLPGLIAAGDYRVEVGTPPGAPECDEDALRSAVTALLAAPTIARTRTRSDRPASGNLRVLLIDMRFEARGQLWMRLRFDPTLGTGRPEEVVNALGGITARQLFARRRHRERLWLRDDLDRTLEQPVRPSHTFDEPKA